MSHNLEELRALMKLMREEGAEYVRVDQVEVRLGSPPAPAAKDEKPDTEPEDLHDALGAPSIPPRPTK